MKSKLRFIGDIFFAIGIITLIIQLRFEKTSKVFALSFLFVSIGCLLNIPEAYYRLKSDWTNSLQIRKYFVGSIFSSIGCFIIFILELIWL